MAEVYLADQTSLNRRVAVKVLRSEMVSDENHLKRFEQEAKAAGGLNHPNIVQVYLIGEQDGMHFIAQEYVQGLNLREFLKRNGPPDVQTALHIMRHVATAIGAAHAAGIVHRDIKPENIMITRKGEVKVADFGLAQLTLGGEQVNLPQAGTTKPVNLTQVGTTMGTPLYMSPEQIRGQKLDRRSDLYSFGVTCYHMLCGSPPFRGETALSLATQHINQTPEPLAERRPDLPPALCQIIHKLMAKTLSERYSDSETLLKDLKRIIKALKEEPGAVTQLSLLPFETASGSHSTVSRTTVSEFFQWSLKRHALLLAVACLLVVCCAAGIGWWLRPGDPLQTPPKLGTPILKLNSVGEQYYRALDLIYDEEAWQAVIHYFPQELSYKRKAQAQLANLYLGQRRFSEAEEIFREFVAMSNSNPKLEARGYAGLAVIASLRDKDFTESNRIIMSRLMPNREHLDRDMEVFVRKTIAENRKILGDEVKEGMEDLFGQETSENEDGESEP